jgi:hypothetical protein
LFLIGRQSRGVFLICIKTRVLGFFFFFVFLRLFLFMIRQAFRHFRGSVGAYKTGYKAISHGTKLGALGLAANMPKIMRYRAGAPRTGRYRGAKGTRRNPVNRKFMKKRYFGGGGGRYKKRRFSSKKMKFHGHKNASSSFTSYGRKKFVKLPPLTRFLHHTLNGGNHISTATGGIQIMYETGQMYNATDITSINAICADQSKIGAAFLFTYNTSAKMLLKSCIATNRITNTSNVGCTMLLYDWVAKHDFNVTQDSIALIRAGLLVEDAANGANDETIVGMKPTDSFEFNKAFKVVGKNKIALGVGEQHTHIFKNKQTKIIDQYDRTTWNQIGYLYSGTIIVAYGDNVHTAAGAAVTTGTVGLDILQDRVYTFTAAPGGGAVRSIGNNIPATPTANQLVTLPETDETGHVVLGI